MQYLHACAPSKRTVIEAHGLMSAHVYKSAYLWEVEQGDTSYTSRNLTAAHVLS